VDGFSGLSFQRNLRNLWMGKGSAGTLPEKNNADGANENLEIKK